VYLRTFPPSPHRRPVYTVHRNAGNDYQSSPANREPATTSGPTSHLIFSGAFALALMLAIEVVVATYSMGTKWVGSRIDRDEVVGPVYFAMLHSFVIMLAWIDAA
jgi:hypothetical protein